MKKLISLLLTLCLLSAQADAFPHGGRSAFTSTIPSPTTVYDFTTETMPAGVSFTRSSAKGCFDNTGTLQQLSSNVPCFDYGSPGSTSLCGLHIEDSRTNNALYSRDFTNAAWTKSTMTAALDQTGIDGVSSSASSLLATAGNATALQSVVLAGTNRASFYLKRLVGTGSVQITSNGGTLWTSTALSSSWTRFDVSASSNPTIGIRIVTSGDKIAVDVAQLETGVDATTPIITTSAAVTRAQDVVADTTNVSGYFNATAGTLEAEVQRTALSSTAVDFAASFDDGTAANNISAILSSNIPSGRITKTNTSYPSANMLSQYAVNTPIKIAVSYAPTNSSAAGNSNADMVSTQFTAIPATDISNVVPPTGITALRIGNRQDGTRNINGCVRKINYYAGDLTSAQKVATTYPDGSGTSIGSVTANLASTSNTIPLDFVGWSAETTDAMLDTIYLGTNTSLIGLVNMLGTGGIFRVGGNAQDTVPSPALTQPIATHLGDFTAALGSNWTIIYGLSSPENDTAKAVTQVGYMLTGVPSNRVLFSVGNEQSQHTTQASWTSAFNSYYSAIKAVYPSALFEGPEDSDANLQSWINGTTPGLSGTTLATYHFYAQGPTPKPTVAQVLAQIPSYDFTTNVAYAGSKLRIGEGNINYSGGTQGITDRLDAATWWLQFAQKTAPLGYNGISQHNLVSVGQPFNHVGYYNFFYNVSGNYYPTPIFYGMYLFSKLQGQQIVAKTVSGLSSNVSVLTTKAASGNANILITNADQSNFAQVTPGQSSAWTTANVLLVAGNSCTDVNPTLNGVAIGAGGSWAGSVTSITNGASISIPPCGAALVQIQP